MLHILLLLLKIIGIMVLIILGVLVLSVCVVLFVPLRYQGEAVIKDGLESLKAHLKFSWFLHLVSGYIIYENKKMDWRVRVLWKKVNTGEEEEKREKPQEIKENKKKHEVMTEEATSKIEETADTIVGEVDKLEEITPNKKVSSKKESQKKHRFFDKIKYTIRTICDKIKAFIIKKEKIEEFLTNEIHRVSWNRVLQEITRFLRYIRPKKLVLNLHFGFEDPSVTGKVLGGLSMLYPFYGKHIDITPDFERKVLEGDAFLKGTVRGMHALVIVWNLIFDKNIRRTYKEIQKWKG